ncbi:MAG: DUF192 domain-containing protein [Bryobacteraceae bacterium]|nr:DUF192 domain-containing protein [Bryobacteraceae bacterium]
MPSRTWLCAAAAILALCAFSCNKDEASLADLRTKTITLPFGQKIKAEVQVSDIEIARGMMFRESIAPDRGMLFIHQRPSVYTYWMYQVKIPLDIIWMDANRVIVEIKENAPPCATKASECPSYGGAAPSQYVLELAGGMASKYGLKPGQRLSF